jgi:general secretion pathway protein D
LQKLISEFVSKDGYSQSVSGTNLIILVDSYSNIKRIKGLIKEIDIAPVDQDITIIQIDHALANDIAEKINSIIGGNDEKNEPSSELSIATSALRNRVAARAGLPQSIPEAASSSAIRSNPIKIIPDERTNSLIVVADEFTTLKIKALVEQLDSELDKSSGRFWVYRLEHADSEELAMVLSNLISGGGAMGGGMMGGRGGSSMSRNLGGGGLGGGMGGGGMIGGMGGMSGVGGRMSGMGSAGGRGAGSRSGGSRQRNQNRGMMGGGGIGAPAGGSMNTPFIPGGGANSTRVTFENEISIASDFTTNSLVINAEKSDYDKLMEVIKVLDVKRRQVLVEATILEVSLSENQGLGVELHGTAATNSSGVFGQTNYGGLTNLLTNPGALSDLTIAAASAGTLTLPGGITIPSQSALITAVSNNSNVNVLSAPTILSTDNQEAEIIVGENVPFVASTGTNQINLGNTFNQIERQDVGITLRITPQIGSGDFLSLQIFVEISNVVPGTRNDPNGPTTTIRTSDTVVAVKNRQMIVTGGLIQDSVTESTRGVPFLQDIPVMGALFRREDEIKRRTNLLIFLTPQIIQDQHDARDQTKIKSTKLASEINRIEAKPPRNEVLESTAIDDVFESPEEEEYLDNVPIRPYQEHSVQNKSGSVYSFEVMKENVSPQKIASKKTFVVLKSLNTSGFNSSGASKKNPSSEGTIGLILPMDPYSQTMFATGSQYTKFNDQFVCIGVYSSQSEAEITHSNIYEWENLTSADEKVLKKDGWLSYGG